MKGTLPRTALALAVITACLAGSALAQQPQPRQLPLRHGFWFSAGVSGFGSASQTGVAALLGLGYDIPVGRSVSLTPYWNGFALSYSGGDANVGQIGLGITVH